MVPFPAHPWDCNIAAHEMLKRASIPTFLLSLFSPTDEFCMENAHLLAYPMLPSRSWCNAVDYN